MKFIIFIVRLIIMRYNFCLSKLQVVYMKGPHWKQALELYGLSLIKCQLYIVQHSKMHIHFICLNIGLYVLCIVYVILKF